MTPQVRKGRASSLLHRWADTPKIMQIDLNDPELANVAGGDGLGEGGGPCEPPSFPCTQSSIKCNFNGCETCQSDDPSCCI